MRILIITITAIISICVFLPDSASAHPAWGIVVDRQGQVYFSDIEAVWKIDRQGNVSVFRAGVSGRHVHNITIDAEDNIYGIDNTYNPQTETYPRALWKMTPKGEFSYLVPMTNNLPIGRSVWRDSGGNTYSVEPYNSEKKETKIMKRTPDGTVSFFAGGKYGYQDGQKDKAEFSVITDIAFGRDEAIYLTDTDRVRKIDKSGTVTTIYRAAGSPNNQQNPESYSRLFGLTVDGQNNVFVADYGNRRVLKITPGGAVSTVAQTEQPWAPTGVALKDDNLYILEFGFTPPSTYTPRVRKLSSDGRITVLATIGETKMPSGGPSAGESSSGGSSERSAESKPSVPYVLLGAGVIIFALTMVTWRVRRRKSRHQH
jgi:sugar lactone lactonase YvrE